MPMKLLCTQSRTALSIPPNTVLTLDGQTVEVWGLARTEEKDGFILQWWIVNPV